VTLLLDNPNSNPDSEWRPPGSPKGYDTALLAAIAITGLTLAALAGYMILRDNHDGGFEIADSSTTTQAPAAPTTPASNATTVAPTADTSEATETTTAPASTQTSTSTTTPTTLDAPDSTPDTTIPVTSNWAIWPDRNQSSGFATPTDAAQSFAVDLAGFAEPIIGEFQAGDSRSGEIQIQPNPSGPITTVLLRQIEDDDSWWVIGAITDDIIVEQPTARDRIGGVLRVTGQARAFEGTIDVTLQMLDTNDPIVTGFVTGRGDGELGDFTKDFDLPSGVEGRAVLLLTAPSAEDGSTWAATAIPIRIG